MVQSRHKTLADFVKEQQADKVFRVVYEAEQIKLRIARLVKTARLQRGWSQAELARRVGTTQSVIARLESATDEREPSLQLLGRLAAAFDLQLALRFEKSRRSAVSNRV